MNQNRFNQRPDRHLSAWLLVPLAGVMLTSLSACGLFSLFSSDDDEYQQARSVPDLDLPPGMSKPPQRDAYKVPGAKIPDRRAAPVADATVNSSVRQLDEDVIEVDDAPASVWRRLGIAFQRLQGVGVVSADENLGVARLRYHGIANGEAALVEVSIQTAPGGKTRVIVRAQASAQEAIARELLQRLRRRLG